MITVENLSKRYGELRAVDRISFEVQKGELFGFLGPNGAGKTTSISMISGLLKPNEGAVRVAEYDVWENPKQAKQLMGLVPQDLALYEEFSAMENLLFWGGLYGVSRSKLKKNIHEILERVGLAGRAKEPVSRFSGGMKRRLNLAIGLIHEPKIILLDEPTVGIDPQARNNILDIIREIAREGRTILFTTHHLEEAEKLCDRIAIMDHGRILQIGSVNELARVVGDKDIITIRGRFSAAQINECLSECPIAFINLEDNLVKLNIKEENGFGIASLVTRLTQYKITIEDLSLQKPTLESVFLKLTGRELRD
ncbi:MAG: ABC transporter ATP-binding protein [Candidatus Omnitrophota bacterium]|jgi:ABC-2 type transport system ATP-binding protein|nr:MAG: ABC transporter ATP-binding protein [Candidatus Omnitrophota bacterium]